MRRLFILLLLTLLPHIFTATILKSSSDDELPWPPLKYTKLLLFSLSPRNEITVEVVRPTNNDLPFKFGQLNVFDAPLTLGDTELGRAQGMFIMSDQNTFACLASMSIIFSGREYIGTTLVLVGRYNFSSTVNELPIVGGTGYFSYAQGVCYISNLIDYFPGGGFELDCEVYYRSLLSINI